MIVLFTDFGLAGPYTGQVKAVLAREAPGVPVIDLFADAPACDPRVAAYLLPPYAAEFPAESVFLCVVDPGVGGSRGAGVLRADERWYVGPENGLFELVIRRAGGESVWWDATWHPRRLSASFHGRDLFAPIAARLALGQPPEQAANGVQRTIETIRRLDWPDDLPEVVYIDIFGNAITGLRATMVPKASVVVAEGKCFRYARTFSEVLPGQGFWYENANGMLEIAVNQGRAAALGLKIGSRVNIDNE